MNLTTYTLGCKVNQYETEYLAAALGRIGYRETPPGESADLVIVNTCTVTGESDAKSRKVIRRLANEHPNAEIVVTGCYASRSPEDVSSLPNVVEVLTDKAKLPDFLKARGLVNPPAGLDRFGERPRAYIKVQDGCRSRCAYCIIPTVRSKMSSRPIPEILEEVRRLVENGYREIVLTGIHLGFYDADGARLHDLIAALLDDRFHRRTSSGNPVGNAVDSPVGNTFGNTVGNTVGNTTAIPWRIRVSSLEAMEVTDELLDLMERFPERLCRHLHLSLQSGSDRILAAMRRPHPSGVFLKRCAEIRRRLPDIALTSDMIVGFPGETDEDFRQSADVIERADFSKVHVFRFSPRAGTEAADMKNRVAEPLKQERAAALIALSDRLRSAYAASRIGRRVQVLIEEKAETVAGEGKVVPLVGSFTGTSDISLPVRITSRIPASIGALIDVTVRESRGEFLIG